MDQIKQAVDAWLALAKHIIPEDDVRLQFIQWLMAAIDRDAPAPKQILVLRARQGVGKTLLMSPFISAGIAVRRECYDWLNVGLQGVTPSPLPPLAVIDELDTRSRVSMDLTTLWASQHGGRAIALSNHVELSGEPLDATGVYGAYDSRAEPLAPTFYADYLESLKAAKGNEKEILAGIKASLN